MKGMILGVDCDSTIWDSDVFFREALKQLVVENIHAPDECDHFDFHRERYGNDVAEQMFRLALRPSRCKERPLYPGVVEAISRLRRWGIGIHVITHNHNPETMRPFIRPWIEETFGEDVEVTVERSSVSKLDILEEIGAFGMVDDKASFICEVADRGMFAAAKLHPHNRREVEAHPEVYGFESWEVLPYLLSVWTSERKEAV